MIKVHRIIICGAFFLLALPARQAIAAPVTSDDFQLVGPDGKITARLTNSNEGTPALFFFDKQGRNRMNLSLYPEGVGGLVMNDTEGRAVAIMRMHGSHERPVVVFKSQGQDRMVVGLRDNDAAEPYIEPVPSNIVSGSSSTSLPAISIIVQVLLSGITGFIAGKFAVRSK